MLRWLLILCALLAAPLVRAQEDVLRRAAELPQGEPGKVDVFALSLAGDGKQWVFGREARRALMRFDQRYASLSRSLLLSNQPAPDLRTPIASRLTLKAAIDAIAARMDKDEDVLMLFLTSHGWKDGSISISNGVNELPPITASLVNQWLASAGIRRTVVVISACYAGSWAGPLANPDRIIMMAARSDRTSFGCSDDREYTFFGDALLEHGLGQGLPLIAAFDRARSVIGGWEKDNELEPSEPQIVIGARIKPVWQAIEARSAVRPVVSTAPTKIEIPVRCVTARC
jgi:Peptidase C13 family